MSILNPTGVSKVKHHFTDLDGTKVEVSLIFTEDGEPILGIDTSEGEVVSITGDSQTLKTLIRTLQSTCTAVYGEVE